jgi:uncharacterized membrane protein YgcG
MVASGGCCGGGAVHATWAVTEATARWAMTVVEASKPSTYPMPAMQRPRWRALLRTSPKSRARPLSLRVPRTLEPVRKWLLLAAAVCVDEHERQEEDREAAAAPGASGAAGSGAASRATPATTTTRRTGGHGERTSSDEQVEMKGGKKEDDAPARALAVAVAASEGSKPEDQDNPFGLTEDERRALGFSADDGAAGGGVDLWDSLKESFDVGGDGGGWDGGGGADGGDFGGGGGGDYGGGGGGDYGGRGRRRWRRRGRQRGWRRR